MSAVTSANLMGITGIARRLVLDGALEEGAARKAMEAATAEKQPLAAYLTERRLVTAAGLASANSIEFGMPLVDALALDPSQSAIALVKEELLRKHQVLPLFKRGGRLFVGTSDPTNHQALDELKFHTNLAVEPILVDADRIKRCLDQWLEAAEAMADEMRANDRVFLMGEEVGEYQGASKISQGLLDEFGFSVRMCPAKATYPAKLPAKTILPTTIKPGSSFALAVLKVDIAKPATRELRTALLRTNVKLEA